MLEGLELDFAVPGIGGPQPICLCNSDFLRRLSGWDLENVRHLLDAFGKKSAAAQGLGAVVTDIHKLKSTDQRLYLHASRRNGNTIVHGGLKIGTKKLFVIADDNSLQEIAPTCVLDFYVHESCQRMGVGKELFEHFLATEQQHPGNVAYDRPSPKLLAFLSKHYGLRDYIPQNNNFVVYNTYWRFNPPKSSNRLGRDGLGACTYSGARVGAHLTTKTTSPLRRMTHAPLTDHTNTSRPAAGTVHAAAHPVGSVSGSVGGAGHTNHHEPHPHAPASGRLRVSVPPSPYDTSSPSAAAGMPSHAHTFYHPHPLTTSHGSHHSGGSSPSAPPPFPLSPVTHSHNQLPHPHSQTEYGARSAPLSHHQHPPNSLHHGDSLDRFRADTHSSGSFPSSGTSPAATQHTHAHGRAGPHMQGPVPPFAVSVPHPVHPVHNAHAGAPTSARMPARYPSPPHAHSSASSPGLPTQPLPSQNTHHPQTSRFCSRPPWGEYYAPHSSHPLHPMGAATHSGSGKLHTGATAAAGTPLTHAHAHMLQQQQLAGVGSPGAVASPGGASVSKAAARAQRSGAGAASCLVW